MKKTIILSVIALAFSVTQINANSVNLSSAVSSAEITKFVSASPLHLAVIKGDFETVEKILQLGTDVDEKWNGMTAAMYAARYNKVNILKLLIENGANLNLKCDKGHTAKYYAKVSNANEAEEIITDALSQKS